jgi:hypothetical protein
MFYRLYFQQLPSSKKISYIRKNGVIVGERNRNGRKAFIYIVNSFFVEALFVNDNPENVAENLETFSSIQGLNIYLEKEFKTSF